jgi:hypothetical protein
MLEDATIPVINAGIKNGRIIMNGDLNWCFKSIKIANKIASLAIVVIIISQ